MVHAELHALANDWRERLARKAALARTDVNVNVRAQKGETILIDELLMWHVLQVFIDNAIKGMQGVLQKKIDIQVAADSEWCSILISDTGRGINKEVWQLIAAGKTPDKSNQSRKGLRTALLIVTGFGGEIQLTRTGHAGSSFEIRLPLAKAMK
jgi:signal transduction histidine kinase